MTHVSKRQRPGFAEGGRQSFCGGLSLLSSQRGPSSRTYTSAGSVQPRTPGLKEADTTLQVLRPVAPPTREARGPRGRASRWTQSEPGFSLKKAHRRQTRSLPGTSNGRQDKGQHRRRHRSPPHRNHQHHCPPHRSHPHRSHPHRSRRRSSRRRSSRCRRRRRTPAMMTTTSSTTWPPRI